MSSSPVVGAPPRLPPLLPHESGVPLYTFSCAILDFQGMLSQFARIWAVKFLKHARVARHLLNYDPSGERCNRSATGIVETSMNKTSKLVFGLLLFPLASTCYTAKAESITEARVLQSEPPARIMRGSTPLAPTAGTHVRQGDLLMTEANGVLALGIGTRSVHTLGGASRVRLSSLPDSPDSVLSFILESGEFHSLVDQGPVTVSTSFGQVRIVGTAVSMSISYATGRPVLIIKVLEGTVEFSNASGTMELGNGSIVSVSNNRSNPIPIDRVPPIVEPIFTRIENLARLLAAQILEPRTSRDAELIDQRIEPPAVPPRQTPAPTAPPSVSPGPLPTPTVPTPAPQPSPPAPTPSPTLSPTPTPTPTPTPSPTAPPPSPAPTDPPVSPL